jgi:threonine dehydrogenase-like Zn-dependent dehydrogenase
MADNLIARALWYSGTGAVVLASAPLGLLGAGMVRLRSLFSGVSRGTERLVFEGRVPPSEYERMRGPHMAGAFPGPVKYGYCAVTEVVEGGGIAPGTVCFVLHPHQDVLDCSPDSLTPVPDAVPARRATLAANMETALNAVWDAGVGPGDRIAVVGAGVVGGLIARLCGRLPGSEVTLVDVAPERAELAAALGVGFAAPDAAPVDCDVVFHASASAPGLATALSLAGFEATVVEVSWYGAGMIPAPLGGPFHSRRLTLLSSQVGHVSAGRRARFDYRRRMAAAMRLLDDPALDALIGETIPFAAAPDLLPRALAPGAPGLAPVISYS